MPPTANSAPSTLVDDIRRMSVDQLRSMPRTVRMDYEARGADTGVLRIERKQDVEHILKAIHAMPDLMTRRQVAGSGMKYVGSVPNLIAVKWATESGTRLYSKEWLEYARKQMDKPEWSKLKVSYR